MKILVYCVVKIFLFSTTFLHDHKWLHVELFSEISHKMAPLGIVIAMETRLPEKLAIDMCDT